MVVILYMMHISSPCRAVLMTATHLGLQVKIKEADSTSCNHPEFLKMNPRGCVPTIDDDGFYLWESRAIMTYLVNKYDPCSTLYPKEPKKRAVVDMMLSFDQGTLYKSQVEYLYPQVYNGEIPDRKSEILYRKSLSILDHELSGRSFVAGDHLTLADLSIVANLALAEAYDYNFSPYRNLRTWLNTLKEMLPYYRDVNVVPLLQFKFCCNSNFGYEGDEQILDDTKL